MVGFFVSCLSTPSLRDRVSTTSERLFLAMSSNAQRALEVLFRQVGLLARTRFEPILASKLSAAKVSAWRKEDKCGFIKALRQECMMESKDESPDRSESRRLKGLQ